MLKRNTLSSVDEGVETLECSHVTEKSSREMVCKLVKHLGKMFVVYVFNMHINYDYAILLLGISQGEIQVYVYQETSIRLFIKYYNNQNKQKRNITKLHPYSV